LASWVGKLASMCSAAGSPGSPSYPLLIGNEDARDEVRVMIRTILKLQSGSKAKSLPLLEGGGEGDYVPTMKTRRVFSDLLSHTNDFLRSEDRRKDIEILYSELEDYLGPETPRFPDFMDVLGRLYINGFEICDSSMNSYGWGVYLAPSIMDHSCQPSAVFSFSGTRLTVTCTKDVSDLSELYISYCDTNLPTIMRKEKLRSNYFFDCLCCKCSHSSHSTRGPAEDKKRKIKPKK